MRAYENSRSRTEAGSCSRNFRFDDTGLVVVIVVVDAIVVNYGRSCSSLRVQGGVARVVRCVLDSGDACGRGIG